MSGILQTLIASIGGAITDTYFNLVTLLLPGNGTNGAQNNTFLDSSTNNFTITRNGNTTQGTFSPFSQTGWSNYFDGTGDYLATPANAAFNVGTSSFTLEAWIYPTNFSSTRALFSFADNNVFYFNTSGIPVYGIFGTSDTTIGSTAVSVNTWTHVAFVRSGSTLTCYLNGVSAGSITTSSSIGNSTSGNSVGQHRTGNYFFGYISNLRLVNGAAIYTSGFTPSTSPLTTTSQGASASQVELLTCQSNRFIDNSDNAFALTAFADVSVQAFSPFAPTAAYSAATVGGSGYFDGSGDYLSVADNSAFNFGTGNFTLEFWIYTQDQTNSYPAILSCSSYNTTGAINIRYDNTSQANKVFVYLFGASPSDPLFTSSSYAFNQWLHVVLVRDSTTTMKLYVNGVQDGSVTISSGQTCDLRAGGETRIGRGFDVDGANGYFAGYISGVKIIKGTAVAPSSIPTSPPTNSSGTSLLTNFTNAGITDATAKNDLETVGNAQISTTQSKFGGSSMYFDGTGDWLTVIDSPNLQMGSGDFTIEGWFYLSATGVAYGIASKGTSTTGWSVNITSGNKLQFSYTSSNLTGATTLSSATWYYFAVVRSGTATGNLKVYLNGSVDATSAGAVTDNFNQTNIMYIGADRVGGSALNGYIDDLRITKGFARTIATPSSAFALQ